jgi:drug/metabolite transporter (DMT)-like permease
MSQEKHQAQMAALLAPLFLGMAPVLGKAAIQNGAEPFTVAAARTGLVVLLLWGGYYWFRRQYLFIYSAGLISCAAIGITNGIGSLFYYTGLNLLDASVAQLINAMYIIFVVILTRIAGEQVTVWTVSRVTVAFVGILFITGAVHGEGTWAGIAFMTGNALLFAGTVVMSQRILYEMPAPTVTLYVMSFMALVVIVARLIVRPSLEPLSGEALLAILALGISTMLSRLLLFAGVKGLGSIQASLMAVAESAVALTLAFLFLGENFSQIQWVGAGILLLSLFMPAQVPAWARTPKKDRPPMALPNVAGVRFRRMAANSKYSTQEMRKLVTLMVGDTQELNEGQRDSLARLLGEEGMAKLREIEQREQKERASRPPQSRTEP